MAQPSEKKPEDESQADIDLGEVLQWTVHPVKRKPMVSVLVTLFIAAVAVMIYWSTESQLFTVLGLLIFSLALAKFYVPTKYRLSDKNIMVAGTSQKLYKDWKQFRTFYPDKNGVFLSPFVEPSRLENFRGFYLMTEKNIEEVTEFIRARIGGRHLAAEQNGHDDECAKDEV